MSSADRLVACVACGAATTWPETHACVGGAVACAHGVVGGPCDACREGMVWDRGARRLRPRRKPGRKGEGRTVVREVHLTPEEWERVKARAEERGVRPGVELREKGVGG